MTTVKVYNYKIWDKEKGIFQFSEHPATRKYIEGNRSMFELIEDSEKEIDINELDEKGRVKS